MKTKRKLVEYDIETLSFIVDAAIRNEHTDDKFISLKEYDNFIRKKKLNKLNDR